MNSKYGESPSSTSSSTSLLERRQKAFPQQVPHLPSLSNLMTETSSPSVSGSVSTNATAANNAVTATTSGMMNSALPQPPTMIYNDYNAQPILTTTNTSTTNNAAIPSTTASTMAAAVAAAADTAALFPNVLDQTTGFVPPLPMQTQLPVYPMNPNNMAAIPPPPPSLQQQQQQQQQAFDLLHHHNSNMTAATMPGGMAMIERQRQSSVSSSNSDKVYSFVAIPGTNHKKRPRRRYDEIERLYHCNWPGCTKSYGTLNHLNAHVSMQQHGPKRHPNEFKEMRKEWRRLKKERENAKKQAEANMPMYMPMMMGYY